jgi:signal transduction histidine kinase
MLRRTSRRLGRVSLQRAGELAAWTWLPFQRIMAAMTARRARLVLSLTALGALASGAMGLFLYRQPDGVVDDSLFRGAGPGVAVTLVGLLIVWFQPFNRIGRTFIIAGLGFGFDLLAAGVLRDSGWRDGIPEAAQQAAFAWSWLGQAPTTLVWVLFILIFPDGRFHNGFWRRFFFASAGLAAALAIGQYLLAPTGLLPSYIPVHEPSRLAGPLTQSPTWTPILRGGDGLALALPAMALFGLLDRFRKANPVVRQQIKWLLFAVAISIATNVVRAPLQSLGGEFVTWSRALWLLSAPLPAAAAALAVFRYRLWDVDLVISRTLVFGLLWVATSAAFLGVALAGGLLVSGPDSRVLSALVLALLVTLVLQPARHRLEEVLTRFVYGERPTIYALLSRLGETLEEAIDVGGFAPRVADAVRRGLGVPWVAVWLYVDVDGSAALRPVATSGVDAGPPAPLPGEVVPALKALLQPYRFADLAPKLTAALRPLWTESPAVVAPILAGEELIGLLACGQRPRDPLSAPDLELLAAVAHEAGLALRNLRLEAELRQRLDEIEQQAEELRRSRQRLVTAQDGERRRIERDLHDGVQQQLVTLAATLRRASRLTSTETQPLLADLAGAAEDAVFALQELARGIYPGVLADQGLIAALRTLAGRLPLSARVQIEPSLVGCRFERELEVALYFVALEAMTNVQKHAYTANVTVSLRRAAAGSTVVLEVRDDGQGFDRWSVMGGSGLQNMQDRIAAVGGTSVIESRPGAGTRVSAVVPLGLEGRGASGRAQGLSEVDEHGRDPAVQIALVGQPELRENGHAPLLDGPN